MIIFQCGTETGFTNLLLKDSAFGGIICIFAASNSLIYGMEGLFVFSAGPKDCGCDIAGTYFDGIDHQWRNICT
jgi:hypothetical protein